MFNLNTHHVSDLLEKNRVVRQNPAERNFHVFYCMLVGAPDDTRSRLQLWNAKKYHYLNQSGCISDPTINDQQHFEEIEVRSFLGDYKGSV